MKKLLVATAVAMTLSAAAHAADSTAVLKLTGTLTNEPCMPSLSGGGTVDFGTKNIDELSATETNQLGSKDLTLTIVCAAPTKMGWAITDNRSDTKKSMSVKGGWQADESAFGSNVLFGVGKTAGGVNMGAYSVSMDTTNSTADGVIKPVIYGTDVGEDGTQWLLFDDFDFANSGGSQVYTVSDGASPIAFTTAVFPLRISLAVQPTDTLAISEETPIDGQATLTMYYL